MDTFSSSNFQVATCCIGISVIVVGHVLVTGRIFLWAAGGESSNFEKIEQNFERN